jgi:hypothetical protein
VVVRRVAVVQDEEDSTDCGVGVVAPKRPPLGDDGGSRRKFEAFDGLDVDRVLEQSGASLVDLFTVQRSVVALDLGAEGLHSGIQVDDDFTELPGGQHEEEYIGFTGWPRGGLAAALRLEKRCELLLDLEA